MSKKKTEKMKENRAGSYVPREFAEEIVATIESYEMEPEFVQGAACVLAYLSCPDGSGMHGAEFPSFLDNGHPRRREAAGRRCGERGPQGHRRAQGGRHRGRGRLRRGAR